MRMVTRVSRILEDAGRSEIEAWSDLLEILLHGLGALRAGDAKARHHRLGEVEIMVTDPGERQIGKGDVTIAELIEGNCRSRRRDGAPREDRDALRPAGGAGGVEDHRDVLFLSGSDPGLDRGGKFRVGD